MKSLILTAVAALGVAHSGAFLSIWEVPYVEDHITMKDFGRKLNHTFQIEEKTEKLRKSREVAAEENYALYNTPTPQQAAKRRELDQRRK